MNKYDQMFNAHGYWPVRCPDHPDHAVNRDDHTGEMPRHVPKHRRPSGDLLLDEANDDERLEGWPGAIYGPDALPWEDAK